jgi:hypothetical protein
MGGGETSTFDLASAVGELDERGLTHHKLDMLIDFINVLNIEIKVNKPTPSTCDEHNVNIHNQVMKFFDKWSDFTSQSKAVDNEMAYDFKDFSFFLNGVK